MPIAEVNALGTEPVASQLLHSFLADIAPGAPITIMLHGYGYAPGHPQHDPHGQILALRPAKRNARVTSWPRRLGLTTQDAGLGIAFGWHACGTLWRAYDQAAVAGQALARLITDLNARHDGPISLFAHSLGARVALSALPHLARGDVARIVALAGAEFCETARSALHTPAGQNVQFLNVTSRENDIYDFTFETMLSPLGRRGPALGAGLDLPGSVTLQIDCPHHRRALRGLGFRTAPSRQLMCHWSAYLRPGLFPLYRAFLRGDVPLSCLRGALPPETDPRWSRLRPSHLPRSPFAVQ